VPDYATAHGHLALIALSEGDYDAALIHAEQAHRLEPDQPDAMHLLARARVRCNRPADAVPLLQRALALGLGKNQAAAQISLAEAFAVMGDPVSARSACEEAIRLGRNAGESYALLGDAARQFGRHYDLAEACYREAVRRDPHNKALALAVERFLASMKTAATSPSGR